MTKKLQTYNFNELDKIKTKLDSTHEVMLNEIQVHLPQIEILSSNFGKTQSQFMDNMLTTSHPTPIRNVRQILAEINKSLEALKEAHFKNKKKEIEIAILERDILKENDDLKYELKQVEIDEKKTQLESGSKYVQGAIRKINNYTIQYNNILKEIGIDFIDEIDFEKEEEEYHIKKAFEQGLNCARTNGRIDEGNQIYLTQLGINGTVAQKCVQGYLMWEEEQLRNNKELTAKNQWQFLDEMYEKFNGSSIKYSEKKGMLLNNNKSMIENKR